MAPVKLHIDILDAVIDVLIREKSYENHDDLKTYALVARAYVPRVQRHLFADLHVRNDFACEDLSTHLTKYPHLASYIERLGLSNDVDPLESSGAFSEPEHALNIITSATNLRHLRIDSCNLSSDDSFQGLRDDLQAALRAKFRTITSLECDWVSNLPMRYIASCTQLKELRIRTSGGTNHLRADKDLRLSESEHQPRHPNQICQLVVLEADRPECFEALMSSPPHYHPLTTLSIANTPLSTLLELLRNAQQTLRVLNVKDINIGPELNETVLDLPLLKTFSFKLKVEDTRTDPLTFPLFILESGSSAPRPLQRVSLDLEVVDVPSAAAYESWRRVDALLTGARYAHFEEMSVYVVPIPKSNMVDYRESLKTGFCESLRSLHGSDRLRVTNYLDQRLKEII